jgi:hypothetical protein
MEPSGKELAPKYRKMHVLGPRQALALDDLVTQHEQATAMRDYNPTLNAMAQTQADMQGALGVTGTAPAKRKHKRKRTVGVTANSPETPPTATVAAAPNRKRTKRNKARSVGLGASTSLALYDACLERLHALKSQFDTSYAPLLQMLTQNAAAAAVVAPAPPAVGAPAAPPVVGAAPPAAAAVPPAPPPPPPQHPPPVPPRPQQLTTPTTPPSTHTVNLQGILSSIPRHHHNKFMQLHHYVAQNPSFVRATTNGRLVLHGKVVQGSSVEEVFRALFVTMQGNNMAVVGVPELLQVLGEIGVPATLISCAAVRSKYTAIQKAAEQAVTSSNLVQSPFTPARHQSGKGHVGKPPCFPGSTIKCLRLY